LAPDDKRVLLGDLELGFA